MTEEEYALYFVVVHTRTQHPPPSAPSLPRFSRAIKSHVGHPTRVLLRRPLSILRQSDKHLPRVQESQNHRLIHELMTKTGKSTASILTVASPRTLHRRDRAVHLRLLHHQPSSYLRSWRIHFRHMSPSDIQVIVVHSRVVLAAPTCMTRRSA